MNNSSCKNTPQPPKTSAGADRSGEQRPKVDLQSMTKLTFKSLQHLKTMSDDDRKPLFNLLGPRYRPTGSPTSGRANVPDDLSNTRSDSSDFFNAIEEEPSNPSQTSDK
ncbi:hypothetical protein FQN49_000069 [Arthroderma sp. PD_2]|nr:hypothetical protein FQN49_000069 [Arthroderma sp. PD_2]